VPGGVLGLAQTRLNQFRVGAAKASSDTES
jgi:hypothetical protein